MVTTVGNSSSHVRTHLLKDGLSSYRVTGVDVAFWEDVVLIYPTSPVPSSLPHS